MPTESAIDFPRGTRRRARSTWGATIFAVLSSSQRSHHEYGRSFQDLTKSCRRDEIVEPKCPQLLGPGRLVRYCSTALGANFLTEVRLTSERKASSEIEIGTGLSVI